jgi:hypothetical protein
VIGSIAIEVVESCRRAAPGVDRAGFCFQAGLQAAFERYEVVKLVLAGQTIGPRRAHRIAKIGHYRRAGDKHTP